jgi:DNA-binding CsgD family transcriptional regulator/tetratricopeptide (TPR) repeat protein
MPRTPACTRRWALEHDPPAALRLALDMAPWWRLRGRYAEGYALLHAAAEHCPQGTPEWGAAKVWLGSLSAQADAAIGLGHYSAARDALEPLGPSPMLVRALAGRAARLRNTGRTAESIEEAHRALAMARDLGDAAGEATALYNLAVAANYTGDHQAELAWLRQAQQIDPDQVPPFVARRNGVGLVLCLMETGDLAAAHQACSQVLASAKQAGAADSHAEALATMVALELRAGRVAEATARLREALGLAAGAGKGALFYCLDMCGHLCAQAGRWGEALSLWAAYSACLGGLPDLPQDIAYRAGPLSKARRALGPDGAQAAEERGAAMTFTTAIEFATMLAAEDIGKPRAAPGELPLSVRERELVTLVAQGRTDAQIAAQLYISVRTVRTHLDRIRDKTGCRRRADLTRLALQAHLV